MLKNSISYRGQRRRRVAQEETVQIALWIAWQQKKILDWQAQELVSITGDWARNPRKRRKSQSRLHRLLQQLQTGSETEFLEQVKPSTGSSYLRTCPSLKVYQRTRCKLTSFSSERLNTSTRIERIACRSKYWSTISSIWWWKRSWTWLRITLERWNASIEII